MKVTIAFPSLLKLWSFRHILYRRPIRTRLFRKQITCICTEEEITLARFLYNGRVEPAR